MKLSSRELKMEGWGRGVELFYSVSDFWVEFFLL